MRGEQPRVGVVVIVETTTGAVRGKERRGIATWRGIPYATAARFRPPRAVAPWTGVRDALEFGPFAMQVRDPRAAMMSGVTDKTQMSEDCLVLNIYAPLAPAQTPRPVLVWIHGGAFIMGAGSQPLYDGTSFAANHDLVVVTINYRLGLFGLMYLGDLLGEEYAAGNAALLDQIAALRWVRDNIAAFGGDPDAVTVMGESAGAVSVAHLLAAPSARGLYQRAILQSGALGLIPRTREDATQLATEIAAQLGVRPEELPTISAERLVAVQQQISLTRGLGAFSPFVDGSTIPEPPLGAIAKGAARGVPIIVGANRDEWMLFDTFLGHASTQLVVAQVRERLGPPLMDRLHASYRAARSAPRNAPGDAGPASTGLGSATTASATSASATTASATTGNATTASATTGNATSASATTGSGMPGSPMPSSAMPGSADARAWVDLIGDMAFLIPAIQLAEAQSAHAPVYMYRFDFGTPMLGAAHALELPFVWNMLDGSFAQLLLGGDASAALPLAAAMHGAWASFIRTGRPDTEVAWPTYERVRRGTRLFDRSVTTADDPGRELREMWDEVLAPLRR